MRSANESSAQHPDPELQHYVDNLKTFLSFFAPGKLQEELWQLTCLLYNKHNEAKWQYSERFNVYGMYKLLSDLCNAMQEIVDYFEVAAG